MQRRSFLKNLGLISAFTGLPATGILAQEKQKSGKRDITTLTLTGRVRSQGKGIAGVAVTDGINVTTTGSDGRYELLSNRSAEFVYISIPAGYAFPEEGGMAQFYKRIDAGKSRVTADFSLDKLTQDDTNHHFVVWADPQIQSKRDADLLNSQTAPDLRDLVKSYPKGSLIHGIGCGDLVWDHFELFEDYRQAVKTANIPFFNVIGNHDMDLDARSDDYSAETFKKQFGPTYYSFNRGSVHYVMMDDVFFIGTAKRYIGYLTENQLQWLEQDLAQVKPGSTVIVSLHIPTNNGHRRRNGLKEDELGGVVSNRERLYSILKPYKVHIMSGHVHINENWEIDNIMEHNHGTVCGAWWSGPICSDGTPNGYGVYEINGSDVKWYYKSTGKPKEHQLRIYPKGALSDAPEEFVANVWNWDPKWKIEWFEDGQPKGEMQQRVGFDPMAISLQLGDQLPKKHVWVEPSLTDHLFFAKPSAKAREVRVRATDRFGTVYEETASMA